MSGMAARLASIQPKRMGLPCSIHVVLEGLPEDDRRALIAVIEVPPGAANRLTSTQIMEVLTEYEIPVMKSALERHRRKHCRCYGSGNPT